MILAFGDHFAIAHVGLGTALIFAVNLALFYQNHQGRVYPSWEPTQPELDLHKDKAKSPDAADDEPGIRREWVMFALCSAAILAAGWLVMASADIVAQRTGMAATFIGATLVAIATSLPELSITVAAVRRGHNTLAISNIFGSNLWDVSLLFIADLFFTPAPLLQAASRSTLFAAALGLLMTCLYLWGLLERRDKTFARLGIDSWLVLGLYAIGLVGLYHFR